MIFLELLVHHYQINLPHLASNTFLFVNALFGAPTITFIASTVLDDILLSSTIVVTLFVLFVLFVLPFLSSTLSYSIKSLSSAMNRFFPYLPYLPSPNHNAPSPSNFSSNMTSILAILQLKLFPPKEMPRYYITPASLFIIVPAHL